MVSIDTHGIQVPLTVYREDKGYRLIDGERRWRCASKLNLANSPCTRSRKAYRARKPATDVQHPCASGTVGLLHDRL